MNYSEWLFNELKSVVDHDPAKFFMNQHTYRDHQVVVFDYSLTIPNDFGFGEALEMRGSAFEVDKDGNFLSLVALPFEKFFNPHEYDYDSNTDLDVKFHERYGVSCDSATVMSLINDDNTVIMDKRDGSIITFFEWYGGELDCKSNSSLTSDYKYEALDIVRNSKPELHDLLLELCSKGYSVSCEYTSNDPYRQIVLTYDKPDVVVLGVRSHDDGSYMLYTEMVEYFGIENVVDRIDHTIDETCYHEENIEGYVVWHQPSGLRFKLKTEWYLDRHRVKTDVLTPSFVWEKYVDGTIDDISGSIPESSKMIFECFLGKSEELFEEIVNYGVELYNEHKHLDRRYYFKAATVKDAKYKLSGSIARNLYNGASLQDAIKRVIPEMIIKRNMSKMGIPLWRFDV